MRLFDTHAHLDFPQFAEDRDALLEELKARQVAVEAVGMVEVQENKEMVVEVVVQVI